ncbi:Sodium-dependent dopamine transporter [Paragonimus heterotremus]|uniref:Transporter n=1 Tax=Paragonimus heterotremus TaxID=100268 RepID=A0A8J4TIC8_9TREM|nr:Sodium-dependent dopamine transporter [Paragonimus heterotremus]
MDTCLEDLSDKKITVYRTSRLENIELPDDTPRVPDPVDDPLANEEIVIAHEEWSHQCDFFLSILGYAVDLANVWRFPYVCFTNGGGAFLIPYFILMVCSALPMFYLELILGQKHRRGAIALWDICPIFRGVGIAQVMISYMVAFYYNTVSAWCLYFLMSSIADDLPWTHCDQRQGNTAQCVSYTDLVSGSNTTFLANSTLNQFQNFSLASTEYFERVVLQLQKSPGLDVMGPMQWKVLVSTVIIFLILYCSMRHGVKSSGKVVYVTALLPYVLLSGLLLNGVTLKGSNQGIWYFIRPRFDRLLELKVWSNAAIQIFFSTGAGFGAHIAYATYNPKQYNCYRDCIITSIVNALTSIFAGFTVFSYLGYLAHLLKTPVETVTGEGPGLVFQVYPFAIGTLPWAPLWAVIFFLLLILLGLDSGMGGLESVITALTDVAPRKWLKNPYFRQILTFMVLGSACCVALFNARSGGMYLFNLMDRYIAGAALLIGSLFQVIAVAWFYGLDQLCDDIKSMALPSPSLYWRLSWKFITPIVLTIMIVSSVLDPTPLVYNYGTRHPELLTDSSLVVNVTIQGTSQHYVYPYWAFYLGILLSTVSVIMIPLTAIIVIVRNGCHFQIRKMISLGPTDYWPFSSAACRKLCSNKGRMLANGCPTIQVLDSDDPINQQTEQTVRSIIELQMN